MVHESSGWLPYGLGGLGALLLFAGWRSVRTTTLVGPWLWGWFALGWTTIAAAWLTSPTEGAEMARRAAMPYLAATASCCPLIAWLGAKRPQDRAWHFIVATLWLVLVLPAAEASILGRGRLDVADLRAWFLWLWIILGIANFAATRFCLASLFWAMAQIALAGPWLPGVNRLQTESYPLLALGLEITSLLFFAIPGPRRSTSPWDVTWREFRDRYGLLWSMRVAERFNQLARVQSWPAELQWQGLRNTSHSEPWGPEIESAVSQCLRSLLGRFVSTQWLVAHGDRSAAPRDAVDQPPI